MVHSVWAFNFSHVDEWVSLFHGLAQEPLRSLLECIELAMRDPEFGAVDDFGLHTDNALRFARVLLRKCPGEALTQQSALYPILNRRLRSLDRATLAPFRAYMRLGGSPL